MRRIASGTLSELFGKEGLVVDKFVRSIGFRRSAEEAYELQDETEREVL